MGQVKIRKKKNGQEVFLYDTGHKLTTRRDFLGAGLISFAGSMVLPSLLAVLTQSERAYAQSGSMDCPTGNPSGLIPLITVNLNGGAALTANWIPMDKGMQLLPNYDKMGLGNPSQLTIESSMGANFAGAGVSRFLVGLKAAAPTAVLRTSFVGVPVQSRDDSNVNKFDITGLAAKAGLAGGMLPNLGTAMTNTGTKNDFAIVKPPTPLIVNSFDDLTSALGVGGNLALLDPQQKTSMFKLIASLNASQSRKLASVSGGKEMAQLVGCASQANRAMSEKPTATVVSPLSNTAFAQVWGINANTGVNTQNFVFASLVYNGLMGTASTVNLDMGGYDYHNNTRTSGDARDEAAGTVVGRILQSAAVLNTKVFVVVTSDGAVSSEVSASSTSPWVSDRGNAGAAYMLGFDPAKVPEVSGSQLGQFTIGQAADEQFITGNSPELAAAAIFANYLSFSKKLALFESAAPRVFSKDQLDLVLKFKG